MLFRDVTCCFVLFRVVTRFVEFLPELSLNSDITKVLMAALAILNSSPLMRFLLKSLNVSYSNIIYHIYLIYDIKIN